MRVTSFLIIFLLLTCSSHLALAQVANVQVIYSKLEQSNLEIELTGDVVALNDALLTSLESGVVKTIYVDTGERVTAGQVLLALDDSLAQIALTQAKAALQSATVTHQENVRLYNEITNLAKNKVVAKTLLAERKSNVAYSQSLLAQAKAAHALQQETVNRHILTAPFSGIIAQRNIDIGEWVNPQNSVLQLVSDDALRIFIEIPQQYFAQVKNTQAIETIITPDSQAQQPLNLILSTYTAVLDSVSRTFQARIDLPENTALISGMSANVKVILPQANNQQVSLPKSALKRHPDGSYSAYAVENKKVKRIGVKLLGSNFNQVIVQGIADNVAIITSGNELLIDGNPVTISNNKGAN